LFSKEKEKDFERDEEKRRGEKKKMAEMEYFLYCKVGKKGV